jgi:hypothetical protein
MTQRLARFLLTVACVCLSLATSVAQAAPKPGDAAVNYFKDPAFKKLYAKALGKSPGNSKNSWVYKDIRIAPSTVIAGQNANTWVHLSTCASNDKAQCRVNHIDVFYDAENQELFAYLTLGSRVGWMGNARGPTSLEQKIFTPYLTAKEIR